MADRVPTTLQIIRGANRTLGRVAPGLAARLNQRLFSTPRRHAARDWELAFEATATRQRLASGVSILGAGSGPVVALLHGWEGRATQFAAFAPALLAAGYRVIAIDGPAHGHSHGRRADPYRFADALHEVQHREGLLHGAVGHSMGGVSVGIALSAGLRATRSVLIAAPASIHEVLHRFAGEVQLPPRATRRFVDGLRADVARRGHSTVDVLHVVETLQAPALIVHARDDREVPFTDGERLAARWPGARLLAVEGVGHRRILRAPAVIEGVVAFLGEPAR